MDKLFWNEKKTHLLITVLSSGMNSFDPHLATARGIIGPQRYQFDVTYYVFKRSFDYEYKCRLNVLLFLFYFINWKQLFVFMLYSTCIIEPYAKADHAHLLYIENHLNWWRFLVHPFFETTNLAGSPFFGNSDSTCLCTILIHTLFFMQ